MSKNIEVILLEDVEGLGEAGSIVAVSEGHARNSLFPEGLAALADEAAKDKKEKADAKFAAASAEELQNLQDIASALDGTELTLEAEVKEGDEIFGSFGPKEIVKELNAQAKLDLKAKDITLGAPITTLGSHDALINLGGDIEATVKVSVMASGGEAANDEEEEDEE